MTPRRSTLRRIRSAAGSGLRTALHLRPTRPATPHRALAPAVLSGVAAVVGLVIATGTSAQAGAVAGTRQLAYNGTAAVSAQDRALASDADVALALKALDDPDSAATHRDRTHRATRSTHRAPLHRWVRPNYGPLTSSFGYRWGRLHEGIDIAGPYGSSIVAVTDGCISYAGPEAGYGEVMRITDWDGSVSLYGHMSSFVKTSGCVKAGQVIARVGSGGDATGAHLHFGLYVGGAPVNPIPYLAKHGLYI
jgi:murein DD-endopeptidase MepM/ murein hydrolase activator NlpD